MTPGGQITQVLRVTNPNKVRFLVSFTGLIGLVSISF